MTSEQAESIASLPASCDQGRALKLVLDLLVAADMDDHVLDDGEDTRVSIEDAKLALFQLACAHASSLRRTS